VLSRNTYTQAADPSAGITPKQMHSQFRGEAIYTAEVDVHFPMLTVGDTLAYVHMIEIR
jgi:hypothetical protein